jgi:hypothetical protein
MINHLPFGGLVLLLNIYETHKNQVALTGIRTTVPALPIELSRFPDSLWVFYTILVTN